MEHAAITWAVHAFAQPHHYSYLHTFKKLCLTNENVFSLSLVGTLYNIIGKINVVSNFRSIDFITVLTQPARAIKYHYVTAYSPIPALVDHYVRF